MIGFLTRRLFRAARRSYVQQQRQEAQAAAAAEQAALRERGRKLAAQQREVRRGPRDEVGDAELLERAEQLVVSRQDGSATMLSREMRIGVLTAVRLMGELEKRGIVGPQRGAEPREVLVSREA
jgi:DNA segregation ATPase FtsK/SpoIIIE-like protein